MRNSHSFLFLAGSISLTFLHHGVPQALAFALKPKQRLFPRPRRATTTLKQSSRPLFYRAPFSKDEKQFQDVREQQQKQKLERASKAKKTATTVMPMENNIKFLQSSLLSGLDRRTAVSATASSCVALLTIYGLLKTGRLVAFYRHASWWIQNAFTTYQNLLVSNPLGTKVGTGAFLAILGDALAQSTTNRDAPYDKRRAASFAVFDSCYRVFQHSMFPAVIALCQGSILGMLGIAPAMARTMERTLVYQLMVVPGIYYPVFFAFTGFIQGLNPKESLDRARSQFFRCWRRNLLFWIPCQMFLFGAVDEKWQIPFACVMGMVWSTILSLTAGKTKD